MSHKANIVVVGSYVTDLTSRAPSLPQAGETVLGSDFRSGPGGKGSNQAVAAHRCGADVTLVTKVGNDVFGSLARDFYRAEGMCTDYILTDPDRPTGAALIMVDEVHAQNMITVIGGACQNITPDEVERCRELIEGAAVLVVQMEINFDALFAVVRIAHHAGVPVVFNPAPAAPIPDDIYPMIRYITPNETEAGILTGVEVTDLDSARSAAAALFGRGVQNVVITLGEMGAFAANSRQDELLPRLDVDAVDSTGAGDAFNGGFATALANGADLFQALRYGNVTGALSVTRKGTAPAMPSRQEVEELLRKTY